MAALFLTLAFWCGAAYAEEYADKENSAITTQADLVLEGTSVEVTPMMQAKDGTEFHAIEEDEDLEEMDWDHFWMVTFEVNKLLKGSFPDKTFSVVVHSPSLSFHLPPGGGRRKYRLYLKGSYETFYKIIGKEQIE